MLAFARDRVCDQCSPCGSNFYIESDCAASTDTQCNLCSGACASGTYQTSACSTTADRQCTPWTVCEDSEFERFEPSVSTDRVCQAWTECATSEAGETGEYESMSPTSTSDRSCTTLRECRDLEEETAAMKVLYSLMWTMSWRIVTALDRPSWRCWRTAGGTWTTPWPRLRDPSESTLNASRFWGLMTALFVFIN